MLLLPDHSIKNTEELLKVLQVFSLVSENVLINTLYPLLTACPRESLFPGLFAHHSHLRRQAQPGHVARHLAV